MKYSKDLTQNHPLSLANPNCLKTLNELNISEGFSGPVDLFEVEVVVLDLDCVEFHKAVVEKRTRKSSMDCGFVIQDDSGKKEFLMVELRYNYINMRNLTRTKLLDKVHFSTEILKDTCEISDNIIFVFQSDLKEQAKSRLFRMLPKVPSEYIVMDMFEVKTIYFD